MSDSYLYRVLVANLLTLYYNLQMLLMFVLVYLKNPFSSPWPQKLKLVPPARMIDPKYGIHKSTKVNNTVLHYVESGDPSKPMMLFLHGYPEFWYSWRHQIIDFQKDYWCIAVDMRGYGDSERPEGVSSYRKESMIEDFRDLIRQLGREKCIIISHDWGGILASTFREKYPEVVSALVMLAAPSYASFFNEIWTNPIQRQHSWYVFMYRAPWIPEMSVSISDLKIFEKLFTSDKNTVDKDDIECYKYWFGKPMALTPPINYYRANFTCDIPEIKEYKGNVPMLVALAQKDPYINHAVLDNMKKEYPGIETTIVDGVGHFLQQEDPEKVNKMIRDFLNKHHIS